MVERPRRLVYALLVLGLSAGAALGGFGIVLFIHGRAVSGIIAELAAASWLVPLVVLGVMAHRRAHGAGAERGSIEPR